MAEPITVTFGEENFSRQFGTWAAFEKWYQQERAHWDWLVPQGETNPGSIGEIVQNAFSEIGNLIASLREQPEELGQAASVVNRHYLAGNRSPLRLSTGKGRAILDVREIAGDGPAAFAYAYSQGRVNLADGPPANVRGAILLMLPEFSKPAELADRLSKERTNNRQAQISAIDRMDKGLAEQAERAQRANADHERKSAAAIALSDRLAREVIRRGIDASKAAATEWDDKAKAIEAELNGIKAAFKEHMHLNAAVTYWEDKRAEHEVRERSARLWLVAYFILAALVLSFAFPVAFNQIERTAREAAAAGHDAPTSLYVLVVGALVAVSTLLFWIGRLLTRLYLSEHHLRNDAAERKVMTTTFMALVSEGGAIGDTDRQIVLSALFRVTPDGIVKDDGISDANIASLISRLATR